MREAFLFCKRIGLKNRGVEICQEKRDCNDPVAFVGLAVVDRVIDVTAGGVLCALQHLSQVQASLYLFDRSENVKELIDRILLALLWCCIHFYKCRADETRGGAPVSWKPDRARSA